MLDDAARARLSEPIDVYDPERLRVFRETLEANPAEVGAFVTMEQGWFCGLLDRAARCGTAEARLAVAAAVLERFAGTRVPTAADFAAAEDWLDGVG